MDDDPLRRGLPSCHIKYGASQAILAGDGLQSLAFEFLVSKSLCIDDAKKIDLITFLSKAIGINGMVYGQSLDMEWIISIKSKSNKKIAISSNKYMWYYLFLYIFSSTGFLKVSEAAAIFEKYIFV